MEKLVEYKEIECWGWKCPNCGCWNETRTNPGYKAIVYCENCKNKFTPVPGN